MSEVKSGDEFKLEHRIKFHGISRGLPRVWHTKGGGGLKENYARNMYNTPLHIDRRARKPAFLANTRLSLRPESSLFPCRRHRRLQTFETVDALMQTRHRFF